MNKCILAKRAEVDESANIGKIILLQKALETLISSKDAREICDIFKYINNLRQDYPTHGDNSKNVLKAHRFFGLRYPVVEFQDAWEAILGQYQNAIARLRRKLSDASDSITPS